MPRKSATVGAFIGSALIVLSLAGSSRNPANLPKLPNKKALAEVDRLNRLGKAALAEGRYQDARGAFWSAASVALGANSPGKSAMNWSNAGYASIAAMQYRPALEDLTRARAMAESSGEMVPLIYTLNNLAALYLHMGEPEKALSLSQGALAGPAGHAHAGMRARLIYQQAQSLADLDRFPEAEPVFRQALDAMMDVHDLDGAARGWSALGKYYIDANRYADAEWALSESLRLARTHRLKAATFALANLAKLRGKQGDREAAETFFSAALETNEPLTPRWLVYQDRGRFRLEAGETAAALGDFREARRLAMRMRADIVPADQDRVALESHASRIFEGLIDAGNRLAADTNDRSLLTETFDAAEQDRLWSLRSLVPEASDWRSRLPPHYWELLARFQSTERSLLAQATPVLRNQAAGLQNELGQAEAAAGSDRVRMTTVSALGHVRTVLDANSVLFSFYITKSASWLWAVDRRRIQIYALPPLEQIRSEAADFTHALQDGKDSTAAGRRLYATLFASVPARTMAHSRWLLEPDGPLSDLPFAALPVDTGNGRPVFLIERAALQSIPGALLMSKGQVPATGAFVGIGDPIFNAADSRYHGNPPRGALMLPRLPNTASEVEACARAWAGNSHQLLTGSAASFGDVEAALATAPAVVHFATHVVAGPGDFGSGLIALGLDARGVLGLLGPKDIAARPLAGSLVVMNGCHSAQGETLPGSGLMGLTRAWIGAGASAVLSTRWNVPDDAGPSLMVSFYRALRSATQGNPAAALRDAQLAALRSDGPDGRPLRWAGYFLLSRIF